LTGYDRVTLSCGGDRAESSRGGFAAPASSSDDLPVMLCDTERESVALFPRASDDSSCASALLRTCRTEMRDKLRREGVRASLSIPFAVDEISGEFRCESRSTRPPNFELHAAAELFAQLFAMRLEIDRIRRAG
jgi:light-regulated signal transduction histidine kinase (bacteriophytochrome)